MKTVPIEEAFAKATQGRLYVTQVGNVATLDGDLIALIDPDNAGKEWTEKARCDAALVVFCLTHFRELREALDDMVAAQIDPMGMKAANARKRAVEIINKTTNVEVLG